MQTKFGIDVSLNSAAAIGGLTTLGQRLTGLATGPGVIASSGLMGVGVAGREATMLVQQGAMEAQRAWQGMASTIGLPLTLTSLFAAVSGITSLKNVLIGANAELETAQMRMAGSMRNWNDSAASSMAKSTEVMKLIRDYAKETPFETQPLINAAAIASQVSRDPRGVFDVTKLGAMLAAYKGTNDPTWSTQAIVSAMQGNFASLQQSFGINANQQTVEALAAQTPYGRTARGRYEALKRLIQMRVGKEGEGDVVSLLAQTGMGVTSTLKDQFSMPLTDMATAGYDIGVKALVRFSAALETFQDSPGFTKFSAAMSDKFVGVANVFAAGLDGISASLERLPALFDRIGPAVAPWLRVMGVVLAVNAGVLLLKGSLGVALSMARLASGVLLPFLGVALNPLVIGGLLALTAALWPLVSGLDVGGQTVEKRWRGLVDSIIRTDLRAVFERPLRAIRAFLQELGEGRPNWSTLLPQDNAFLADIAALGRHVRIAFSQALVDVFPEAQGGIDRLNSAGTRLRAWLTDVGIDVPKLALFLGGITLAFRALGLGSPWLMAAGAAMRGAATGLGLVQIAIANPLLAAGVLGLVGLFSGALTPALRDVQIAGRSLNDWMGSLGQSVAAVDWAALIAAPLGAARSLLSRVFGGEFSFTEMLGRALDPGSLLVFIGSLARPLWTGLLGALDQVFPEVRGYFTRTFGNLGTVLTDVFRIVSGVVGPLLDGAAKTLGPTLGAIGAVLGPLIGFAWGALSSAIHALAELVASPGMQTVLKVIGGLAGIAAPFLLLGRVLGPVFTLARGLMGTLGGLWGGVGALLARIPSLSALSALGGGSALRGALVGAGRGLGGLLVSRFPLLGTLGGFAARVLPLLARIPALFGPLLPILARIGAFFVGGPIGWAVGIVSALVAGGVALYNHWRPFHDLVDRIGDRVRVGFAQAVAAGGVFLAWVRGLPAAVGRTWEQFKEGAALVGDLIYRALSRRFNDVVTYVMGLPGRLGQAWDAIRDAASTLATTIYESLLGGIKLWVSHIPAVLSGFMDLLPAPLKALLEWVQTHLGGGPAAASGTAPGAVAPGAAWPQAPQAPPEAALPVVPLPAPPVPTPTLAVAPAGSAAPVYVSTPMTVMNAAGMTPEEVDRMVQRNVSAILPEALDKAINGVRFA